MFLLLLPRLIAEEIQLKDGTKLTGKIVALKNDVFEVKTTYGEINVPRSDVLTIAFPENQPKPTNGEATVVESLTGTAYINRTGGFRITMPIGWQLAPEMRKNKDIIAALKSPDGTQFFLVTPELFAGTLATYKVLAETQYKSKFSDYEKISESEAQLDGRNGIRLVFQGKLDKAASWKSLVYILPYNGRMVRLSFLTLEPLFNDAAPAFEKIAASYRSLDSNQLAEK